MPEYVNIIVLLIIASTPFSIIGLKIIGRVDLKHSPHFSKVTTICTNILSTLTKDDLDVKTIYFDKLRIKTQEDNDLIELKNTDTKEKKYIEAHNFKEKNTLKLIAITSTLCHYANLQSIEDIEDKTIDFLKKCNFNPNIIRRDYELIEKIPSNSQKKISTVVTKRTETQEIFSFCKGNPYKLLEKCNRILIEDKKIEITPSIRQRLKNRIKKMNKNGQKVIAFAYKGLPLKQLDNYTEEFTENDLTLVALIGFINPVNTEIIPSIEKAKEMGLKLCIITEIQEEKAVAIAKELDIINKQYFEAVTGDDLKNMKEKRLKKILKSNEKDYIFVELDDEDKNKIIEMLKKLGQTVAYTSKQKQLEHILESIEKGRNLNQNYRKCFSHALSCKIAEFLLIISILILQIPVPYLIPIILIMDIPINLGLELSLKAEKLEETPYASSISHILLNGCTIGVITILIYIWNLLRLGWIPQETILTNDPILTKSNTIILGLFALFQIFSAYNIRKQKSIFKHSPLSNLYLALTTIITILILYSITTIPTIQKYIHLSTLTATEWILIIFAACMIMPIEEIRKYIHKTCHSRKGGNL